MQKKPLEFRRLESSGLAVQWSSGESHEISSENLRKFCPCATCKELRGDGSHAAPLTPKKGLLRVIEASSREETALVKIWPVGNYALGMEWADGHATGIYTYDYLYELGSQVV